jgi:hypothetical protein
MHVLPSRPYHLCAYQKAAPAQASIASIALVEIPAAFPVECALLVGFAAEAVICAGTQAADADPLAKVPRFHPCAYSCMNVCMYMRVCG